MYQTKQMEDYRLLRQNIEGFLRTTSMMILFIHNGFMVRYVGDDYINE